MNNFTPKKTITTKYSVCELENKTEVRDGMILLPYLMVDVTNTNRDEYDKLMEQYDEEHKYCPECGSERYGCTLVGYILDLDHKDDYKDLNRCTCVDCGDCHTVHDRVKIK